MSLDQKMSLDQSLSLDQLPIAILGRIFAIAGLKRPCPIVPGFERPRLWSYWMMSFQMSQMSLHRQHQCSLHNARNPNGLSNGSVKPRWNLCTHAKLPISLLRVNRNFYSIASMLLYGGNTFVFETCARDVATMTAMAGALSKIRRLHFHVMRRWEQPPTETVKSLWFICDVLSSHMQPGQLRLTLQADDWDGWETDLIMTPLLQLPRLKDVAIQIPFRGVRDEHAEIQALLDKRCRQFIGHTVDARFPFEKLPVEIQLMVLNHTELVTAPRANFQTASRICPFRLDKKPRRMGNCWVDWGCGPSPYCNCSTCSIFSVHPHLTPEMGGCRCRRAGTWSSTCTCKLSSAPLFRVSKKMRALAYEVFNAHSTLCFRGNSSEARSTFETAIRDGRVTRNMRSLIIVMENICNCTGIKGKWSRRLRTVVGHMQPGCLDLMLLLPKGRSDFIQFSGRCDYEKIYHEDSLEFKERHVPLTATELVVWIEGFTFWSNLRSLTVRSSRGDVPLQLGEILCAETM